jgi:hypothetical protein
LPLWWAMGRGPIVGIILLIVGAVQRASSRK